MKTTLEIPNDLFRRTKAEAALRGIRMKDLVIDALEQRLGRKAARTTPGWRSVFGRASRAAVKDVDVRVAADLERVDPDEWK